MKNAIEIKSLLQTVMQSCREGMDGTWDCSTEEGKEGFQAMIDQLDEAIGLLGLPYKNANAVSTVKQRTGKSNFQHFDPTGQDGDLMDQDPNA